MDSTEVFRDNGWKLSTAGVTACEELCKEKGLKLLTQAALDLDLRSISEPTLPETITHNEPMKIQGPIVLQVQKVKNVAVPSGKQHQPSSSKRLLKLVLTDGHSNLSAAETEGPIEKLSPITPPGTKMRLTGSISIVNGFIMLKKSSTKVLGGSVEVLLKKWKLNQALPDNLERAQAGGENGPPQFLKFSQMRGLESLAGGRAKKDTKSTVRQPSPAVESAPTRTLMDLPPSYRTQSGKGGKGVEGDETKRADTGGNARGSGDIKTRQSIGEGSMEYTAPPKHPTDHLLSDYISKLSVATTPVAGDIEDLGKLAGRGRGQDSRRGRAMSSRGRGGGVHHQESQENRPSSDSRRGRGQRFTEDEGRREGRGRGRGRRHDREDQDDYYPQRQRAPYKLSDFLTTRPTTEEVTVQQSHEDSILKDYEYDPVSDSYYIKEDYMKSYYSHGHAPGSSGTGQNFHGRDKDEGRLNRERDARGDNRRRGGRNGHGAARDSYEGGRNEEREYTERRGGREYGGRRETSTRDRGGPGRKEVRDEHKDQLRGRDRGEHDRGKDRQRARNESDGVKSQPGGKGGRNTDTKGEYGGRRNREYGVDNGRSRDNDRLVGHRDNESTRRRGSSSGARRSVRDVEDAKERTSRTVGQVQDVDNPWSHLPQNISVPSGAKKC